MSKTLRVIPLGGCGEIGLNMTAFEYGEDIIVVDCGLMFPEDYMLGIDIVIPEIGYLKKNKDRCRAFIITHGHEDHIGALPFVLRELNLPVYATALTTGLIESKLKEFGLLGDVRLNTIRPRDVVTIGDFSIEFLRVSHSIPDCVALAITTPLGVVIHTGDFKLDQTPVDGERTDYARLVEYGEKGVLLLLSDSTNVESEGYSPSESVIGGVFEDIFRKAEGRIIVSVFSSNIHRIQQVFQCAFKTGRKVILNGRSIVENVRIARERGYLYAPDGVIGDIKEAGSLPPQRVVVLTTGSQGEPMSALIRMAMGEHRHIKIREGDTVLLSAKFIPGHEKAIANMMNHLYRRGADVIYERVSEIHVSGHAAQEELKLMLNMTKPRYFIPIHGEYRHLVQHGKLAATVGVAEECVFVLEDGDVLELKEDGAEKTEKVEAGKVFVDGKGVGDVKDMVLKHRRDLSRDGMVITVIALNEATGEVIYGPDIVTRGVVSEEAAPLMEEARELVLSTLKGLSREVKVDQMEIQEEIRRTLRKFFNVTLERRPVILPVIIEI